MKLKKQRYFASAIRLMEDDVLEEVVMQRLVCERVRISIGIVADCTCLLVASERTLIHGGVLVMSLVYSFSLLKKRRGTRKSAYVERQS